ncbi:alpha/beta hydrolase [Ruegeria lacuscaerulensis]|uniref:alpha/beta fold hydrolase n=1 Tax=Ruegeria lacuscaerulensis TaxID=55218 RepID=UPI002F26D6F3
MKDLMPSVHVRTLGQGERKVLALHCTIAHSGAWAGLVGVLGDDATFIAPDMPSHGKSPDWNEQGDLFDLLTELTVEQLTEPMDVIGHSFGAMIALRLAMEHPDLVRSAVLIEPVFFAVAKQDAPDLLAQHDQEAQPYAKALADGDMELAARLFNRMWSTDDSPRWPDLPERTRAAMTRGVHLVPAVKDDLFEDKKGLLAPDMMSRANMPILLVNGSRTHPAMPAICEGLQQRLPNASGCVIEGAGHMAPITHARDMARVIRDFWDGQP